MSPVLPREERDAIRARAEAATTGPWFTLGPVATSGGEHWDVHAPDGVMAHYIGDDYDAEFIAHARTDVPALLDALDAAEEENERLRAIHQAISECRDDPAKAIVDADRIAGEHIIRAHLAETALAALREQGTAILAGIDYLRRVRSMQPSTAALDNIARQEAESLARLRTLLAADEGERTGR